MNRDIKDEFIDWVVIFYGALSELIELKNIKDSHGKIDSYLERQPKAWHLAKEAVELWKKSDYGSHPEILKLLDERTSNNNGWISVKDRPLIIKDKDLWVITQDGQGEFLAAVPYNDSREPEAKLWWIRHCVIEYNNALCVVGDDENYASGWQIEDVIFWQPLPKLPK